MDSELLKALDDWLFKNEKKYAEAIKKKKAIIPDHFNWIQLRCIGQQRKQMNVCRYHHG